MTEAALAIVAAKPDSPVALLADGTKRATVFAPTDQAFRVLVKDLTGQTIKSEKKIFESLVALAGVATVEGVLLYHVIPGKTLTWSLVTRRPSRRSTTAGRPSSTPTPSVRSATPMTPRTPPSRSS